MHSSFAILHPMCILFISIYSLFQGRWTNCSQAFWLAWRENWCAEGGSFWISGSDEIGKASLHLHRWSQTPMWSCFAENVLIAWKVSVIVHVIVWCTINTRLRGQSLVHIFLKTQSWMTLIRIECKLFSYVYLNAGYSDISSHKYKMW